MIRVVLDANVYVSAVLHPAGTCGRLIAHFLEHSHSEFEVVLSPAILEEVLRAFTYPKVRKLIRRDVDAAEWLENIAVLAVLVPDTTRAAGACRDPGDDKYLSAAIEGRASTVVTGDQDLLTLGQHEHIRVLTPAAFLRQVKTRNSNSP